MTGARRTAVLADSTVPLQQVLARGRIRDVATGAPLEASAVTLTWQAGDSPDAPTGSLPVRLAPRAGGWFALHLVPGAALPDLAGAAAAAGAGMVTLTARVTARGRDAVEVSRAVPADDLSLENVTVVVGGTALTVQRVAGVPVDVSVAVPPRPVGLRGVVLRAHDPAEPVAGAGVAVTGGPTVTTDSGGRFVVDALPIAATVEVTVSLGPHTATTVVRPDYSRPFHVLTVSLPG